MPIRVPEADVDLWSVSLADAEPAGEAERCRAILAPEERDGEMRFAREELRRRWRATRAMVRRVLSRYADVPPEQWQFRRTSLGKPEVVGPIELPLAFNLAHSGRVIICGVAAGETLGVDVEQVRRRPRYAALARRFFTAEEVAWLERQPLEKQPESFLRIWTLKEAYLKARGTGLSLPLRGFSVSIGQEHQPPRISFTDRWADDPRRWRLAEWRDRRPDRAEGYRLAVALRGLEGGGPLDVARHVLRLSE